MAKKIEVQIVGDADSFHKAMSKAQQSTSKVGSVLGGAFKAGAYAAAGGIVALGAAAKIGFDEFNQAQAAMAQTNAVIKSTGGLANVTAKHVKDLSGELLNLSGVDDEVIQSGENVLLTFRNIRNEAGKGNDIFDQATKATLDLSVALGKDMKSSAILVGKALNDPLKGLTALTRAGVQFSDKQTDLIKHLVETGKTAEAQKMILKELTKEFGGSAKAAGSTFAGQMNVLKESFKNAAGEIVATLMPYVVKLANFAFPLVVDAIKLVVQGAKNLIKWIGDIASHFEIFGNKSASASDRVRHAFNRVSNFFKQNVMPIITQLRDIFREAMRQIAKVVQKHGEEIRRIANRVGGALKAIAEVAIPILKFTLTKVLPKAIGVSIEAIDKMTFALEKVAELLKWIGKHSPDQLKKAADAFKSFGAGLVQYLIPGVGQLLLIKDTVQWLIDHIPDIPTGPSGLDILGSIPHIVSGGGGTAPPTTMGRTPPIQNNIYLDGKQIHTSVANTDRVYRRQNGRSAFA